MRVPLWRQPPFVKLWAGQAISLLGSQVTNLALALVAAAVLQATPVEMGLIGSLNVLPLAVFGLPAGVWVDRVRRRPVLVVTDIGRAALLASVPVAALGGWLSMPQLYIVSLGHGAFGALFRVAYGSFLPSVVSRADLAEGNQRLALAEAVARAAGPGLAGGLVQLLSAPLAIVVDCLSFLVSAGSIAAIGVHEAPTPVPAGRSLWSELGDGFGAVFGQRLLRPLFVASNLGNVADGLAFQSGIIVLFLTRELHLTPAVLGGIFAGLGIGGLIGAALAVPVTRVLGLGSSILISLGLWGIGYGGLALVPESSVAPVLIAGLLGAVGAINPIAGANVSTIRQLVTPDHLLGRVTAVVNVGSMAALMAGSLGGGFLADHIGLRATLLLSGLLPLLGLAWLVLSPIRSLRQLETT